MKKVLDHYEVNRSTMALLSVCDFDYSTIVLEESCQYNVRKHSTQIVKEACLDGISTYDGRRKAVSHHTGTKHKVPIPINPYDNIFAFPTHSPKGYECNWIFPNHVKKIQSSIPPKEENTQSIIIFNNGQQITLNESHYVLEKQMLRTAMCIMLFSRLSKSMDNFRIQPNIF